MAFLSKILIHMYSCMNNGIIYIYDAVTSNRGGMLIINSIIALIITKILPISYEYLDIILNGTSKKNLIVPFVICCVSFVIFFIANCLDTFVKCILYYKKRVIKIHMIYSEFVLKCFCYFFLSIVLMLFTILFEILHQNVFFSFLYNTSLTVQLVLFLLCFSFELNSFNRTLMILRGKGFKIIDLFSEFANIVAKKTMINQLSSFNIDEKDINDLEDKIR